MTNPASIARGLTDAQRQALCDGHQTLLGNHVVLSARINWKVDQNLRRKGLAELHDIFRLQLTETGLAVRQYLERNPEL